MQDAVMLNTITGWLWWWNGMSQVGGVTDISIYHPSIHQANATKNLHHDDRVTGTQQKSIGSIKAENIWTTTNYSKKHCIHNWTPVNNILTNQKNFCA